MDREREFQQLKENRLMKDIEEVKKFEQALQVIMEDEDVKSIRGLCGAFDDATEQEEVMYGLIHAIEYLGRDENVLEIAESISIMLPHAKEWAKLIHYGILNVEKERLMYAGVISTKDETMLGPIVQILQEIKAENPYRFGEKVDHLLWVLKEKRRNKV